MLAQKPWKKVNVQQQELNARKSCVAECRKVPKQHFCHFPSSEQHANGANHRGITREQTHSRRYGDNQKMAARK